VSDPSATSTVQRWPFASMWQRTVIGIVSRLVSWQ
jgi:hypothetical protein